MWFIIASNHQLYGPFRFQIEATTWALTNITNYDYWIRQPIAIRPHRRGIS